MRRYPLLLMPLLCAGTACAVADGSWLTKVPAKERDVKNPYAGSDQAVAAGAILYERSCASCHGTGGQGIGSKPSLRSIRVHQATDGELHWLLTNGNLSRGMPSWSRLPDAQRWQIIRYVHSLPLDEGTVAPPAP